MAINSYDSSKLLDFIQITKQFPSHMLQKLPCSNREDGSSFPCKDNAFPIIGNGAATGFGELRENHIGST